MYPQGRALAARALEIRPCNPIIWSIDEVLIAGTANLFWGLAVLTDGIGWISTRAALAHDVLVGQAEEVGPVHKGSGKFTLPLLDLLVPLSLEDQLLGYGWSL